LAGVFLRWSVGWFVSLSGGTGIDGGMLRGQGGICSRSAMAKWRHLRQNTRLLIIV